MCIAQLSFLIPSLSNYRSKILGTQASESSMDQSTSRKDILTSFLYTAKTKIWVVLTARSPYLAEEFTFVNLSEHKTIVGWNHFDDTTIDEIHGGIHRTWLNDAIARQENLHDKRTCYIQHVPERALNTQVRAISYHTFSVSGFANSMHTKERKVILCRCHSRDEWEFRVVTRVRHELSRVFVVLVSRL